MKAPTLEQNAKRGEYLDALYELDERGKPGPNQGTYTGLHQEVLIAERVHKELLIYEKWKARGYFE